jgi:hypothetical protein
LWRGDALIKSFGNLGLIKEPFLVLVGLGEELFYARQPFFLGQLSILVGVESL